MIERLPGPHDLAVPRELDDHVAHDALALPGGLVISLAAVPVVKFTDLSAHHEEVPIREFVDLVMHRQRWNRNSVRFSLGAIGGVPVSDPIAKHVDFCCPVVCRYEYEIAVSEGLDIADPCV